VKKRILVLIALMSVLLLVAAPVHATPPMTASGTWCYTPAIVGERWADGNLFLDATSVDEWTGTFNSEGAGSGTVYRATIHKFVDFTETGPWYAQGLVTFVGTVEGKSGTLVMVFLGKRPGATADWSGGKWVILSGTDELANLRGQGTWWGPGAPAPGVQGCVDYSGNYDFETQ
jgi:hypothetical protein